MAIRWGDELKLVDLIKQLDKEEWNLLKKYIDDNFEKFSFLASIEKIDDKTRYALMNEIGRLKKDSSNEKN